MDEHNYRQFRKLWKWVFVSFVVGPSTALIVAGFVRLLPLVVRSSARILPFAPWLAPLLGAMIVGALVLRQAPGAGGEGIPDYLIAVNRDRGRISLIDTVLKIPATLITLGAYCSGGIVGPLSRIGAGTGSHMTRLLFRVSHIHEQGILRIAAICGVSGIISSIFHAPVAGGIFAAEILCSDALRYSDLFPSILTGCTAYVTSAMIIGDAPVFSIIAPPAPAEVSHYLWLPLVAAAAGAAGILFIITYEKAADLLKRVPFGQPAPAVISGIVLSILYLAGFRELLSSSPMLVKSLASGDMTALSSIIPFGGHVALLILVVLAVKVFSTSVTVGGGMSAGFTGPMIVTGLSCGALFASIAGIDPGSPDYYMLMASSTAAVLGAALNIPIAAILLVTRLFGMSYLLSAAAGSILAFVIYKNRTIYEYSVSRWPAVIDRRHTEL